MKQRRGENRIYLLFYPPEGGIESDWILEDDRYVMRLPNDSINPKDLVYGVGNTFRKFARQALPYEFDLILKVRDDAPYECYGTIDLYFDCSGKGNLTDSYTWNDRFSQEARGMLYFRKVRDTIYFYDVPEPSNEEIDPIPLPNPYATAATDED